MPRIVRAGGGDDCFVDRELFPEISEKNSNTTSCPEYIHGRSIKFKLVYNKLSNFMNFTIPLRI